MKRLIRWCGALLVLLSFLFMAKIVWENVDSIGSLEWSVNQWLVCLVAIVIHMTLYVLISYAWWIQLRERYPQFSTRESVRVVGRSQIAKYLPGNVAHFLGRVILLPKDIKKLDASYTLLVENVLVVGWSFMIGALYVFYYGLEEPVRFKTAALVIGICTLLAVLAYPLIQKTQLRRAISITTWPVIVKVSLLVLLSACLSGVSVFLLSTTFFEASGLSVVHAISGFALSWVVGYIVPGAPGGIGVREAVFVALFQRFMPAVEALQVIVIFRLVTIIADLLLYWIVSFTLKDDRVDSSRAIEKP